jgi:hypothetical protein
MQGKNGCLLLDVLIYCDAVDVEQPPAKPVMPARIFLVAVVTEPLLVAVSLLRLGQAPRWTAVDRADLMARWRRRGQG